MLHLNHMAVILKIRIAEKTGELIKVISQFQNRGHPARMHGKEQTENPDYQIVALKLTSDAKTAQSLAEEFGYQVVSISDAPGEYRGDTETTRPAQPPIDIGELRTRYISVIGPIGGALFDETVEALGDQVGTPNGDRMLAERLAEQIEDEDEAVRFRLFAGVRV